MTRIAACFEDLRRQGRAGLVSFITAGDPDPDASFDLLCAIARSGTDLIELGMPFTDPMADGPAIQEAGLRALKAGMTLRKTLDMVRRFRDAGFGLPVILMGYFNPVHAYGVDRFLADAKTAGIDGLIMVDLPPEEDDELCVPARAAGLDFIRLATPTTDSSRLPSVLARASGFLYYVSVTGVTGAGSAETVALEAAMTRLRTATDLPIAIGFGIKTPAQAAAAARVADAVVVGSAIVSRIGDGLETDGRARDGLAASVAGFVKDLADAVHAARGAPGAGH